MLLLILASMALAFGQVEPPEKTVMVMVAARDLYQGVAVTEEDLYAVEIAPRYLPKGVFLSPDLVLGRKPHSRILTDEFVRAERFNFPPDLVSGHVVSGQRMIDLPIGPTSMKAGGVVDLVGPEGCLVQGDVYLGEVRSDGESTATVMLPIEHLGRIYAVAAAGDLRIAASDVPKKGPCSP